MYTKQLAFKRLLFLIFSLVSLTTINAVNYTVNSAAAGNTGVGTAGTLQYCAERANANTDGVGPHVITFSVAGTFNYSLNFFQGNNNITIDGAAFPNAIIINQTAQASGNNNTLIFQNLTFSNVGGSAFNMGGAGTAFTFNNVRVLNCNGTGISIYSGASVTGSNLTIRSITNGSGISVSGPSLTLSNSTIARISGNGINANGAGNVNVSNTLIDTTGNSGINIAGGGNLTVSNNSIIRNVTGGHGIAKDGAGSSNISNTTISNINGSNFNGIYIGSGTPNVINNVTIRAVSNGHGIEKRGTGTLTTSLTTIENINGNDKNGIYVDAGSAINITLSKIRNIKGGNGIQLNAASSGRISGVLFGLADDGITATGNVINKSAILINNGTINNFTIGGTGLANRNIISNSLENGVKVLNVGTGFSIVNNFIGTDITGSLARPNGSTNLETDGGINIQTGTNIAINQNLISGNYGVGIFAAGGNNGLSIKGNIIGLDSTGFKPLSNVTLGVKISNATGVTIGGSAANDRNIISANGTNITHVSNSSGPTTYDWTNMAGIFWSNVRSSTIENNYIGTAISGNTTTFSTANDLGNWNGGIKIESGSSNNTIRNNVVGGNGFRSAVTQVNHYGTIGFLKGHGILIKDGSSSTNLVVGNRVGVGTDGSSKIGNKQDGISIQGASNTTIGGATIADRNISSNNTYGIYVSSNYNGSKATNIFIYGNYLGTDATGTVAIGNGVRSDIINEGAGIGIRDSPNNLLLGGGLSGQGNLISGNNMGIELIGDVSSVSRTRTQVTQIKNNVIGLQADVVSVLPNLSYGIAFTAGASRNIIGGSGATDGNYISGNLADGIHMVNADSTTIQGNFIGVDINRAAKPNTGDGINLRTDSDNNIIGGVNTGEANTIGRNTGNGVQIMDATSTKNLIRKNIFLCNASRGVVLNGGNNAFATPLLTGTSTNLVITATTGNYPAGTIIDIYEVDETCASCPTNGTRLQGAVFVTSLTTTAGQATWTGGTAGKYYTALAHEGATNTFLNTSEFSGCYAVNCTTPLLTPTVTASPKTICENGSVAINITNTQSGISYQAFIGSTNIGAAIVGDGNSLPITLSGASLPVGNNIIGVKATTANACTTVTLTDTALVRVNAIPVVTGNLADTTVCSNSGTVWFSISNTIAGVSYQAKLNSTNLGSAITGNGGKMTYTFNASSIALGLNTITLEASIAGCAAVTLTDRALVTKNSLPSINGILADTTVCSNSGTVWFSVSSTTAGATYQAKVSGTNIGTAIVGTGGKITYTLPASALATGVNTIDLEASVNGCAIVTLTDKAIITKNTTPSVLGTLSDTIICSNTTSAWFGISATNTGVIYQAKLNGSNLGTAISGNGGKMTYNFNPAVLANGANTITLEASVAGCAVVTLADQAIITKNIAPSILGTLADTTVCSNSGTVWFSISSTTAGATYQAKVSGTNIGTAIVGTGGKITYTLPASALATGVNTIDLEASANGCAIVTLTDKAVITKNTSPSVLGTVSDSIICSSTTNAWFSISPTTAGVSYQALLNGVNLGSAKSGNGDKITYIFTASSLATGDNLIDIQASVAGCDIVTLTDKANITKNKLPEINAILSDTTVCSNSGSAWFSIPNSELGVSYQAVLNSTNIGTAVLGNGQKLVYSLVANSLNEGVNLITVNASIAGCGVVTLTNQAKITKNKAPNGTLVPTNNGPACTGSIVTVTIPNAETGVIYEVLNGITSLGSDLGKNADLNINITAPGLAGDYPLTVKASISGCASVDLPNTILKVNQGPIVGLEVTANGPLCSVGPNSTPVITIKNAQSNVNYTVVKSDDTPVAGGDSPVLTGSDLVFTLSGLSVGTTNFKVTTEIAGCTKGELNTKPSIVINKLPSNALEINAISPICEGIDGSVSVVNAESGVSYQALINTSPVGSAGNSNLTIPSSNLALALTNIIKVNANIAGCEAVLLDDTATIYVSPKPNVDLEVIQNGPICTLDSNTLGIVTIKNSGLGVNYTVFNGNTAASSEIKGTGNDLPIKLTLSTAGTYSLTVRTQVAGCGIDSLKNKVTFVINESPDVTLDLVAASNEICQNGQVELTIKDTKLGYTYSFIQNDTLLTPSLAGTGGDLPPFIKILNKAGLYTYKVQVQIAGCSSDTLNKSVAVVVNPLANDAINLDASNNTICLGNTISINLSPVQDKVKYELFDNGTLVQTINSSNSPITFPSLTPTTEGFHEYFVLATSKGCTAVRGLDTAGVQVNDLPDTLAKLSYDPIICSNENAIVSVAPAKSKTTYSLYNNTILLNTGLVSGSAGSISLNGGTLNVGKDTLSVFASIPGCKTVKITEEAIFKINKAPNLNLNLLGSSVCLGQNGEVTVLETDTNATYFPYVTLYRRPNKLDSLINAGVGVVSAGGEVKLDIPNNKLTGDVSTIKVSVFVEGCDNQLLNDTALVYQLNKVGGINGSSVVCEGSTLKYNVTPSLGALNYSWSLSGVNVNQDSAYIIPPNVEDTISVKYGLQDTLFIKVSPIGNLGACTSLEDSIQVIVYPPLDGSASILLRETVCLFDTDTLEFGNVVNVSGYQWSWTDSLQTIDTLVSPITYDKIVIKYMSTGFDTITLKLYSPCLIEPLVITKVIRILGPPTVDAGTYGIVPMLNKDIRSIDLNPGVSTSENGPAPNDTLAYQWTELRGSVVDKSDDRDNASFKPRTLTNIVQLQVYHKALPYCAASDTAKVIIDLGIVIPNVFTPNNEGPLDTEAWNITNLSSFYPNATLQIYNKWGALLREFRGGDYSVGWDGTRNGQDMPVATYYFILDLKNGIVHTGSVTLLR